MEKIIIHFGSDSDFSKLIENVDSHYTIGDVIKHISKETIAIEGASKHFEAPLDVENLIIYTDDYGGIKEWAILGVSNNIFENPRIQIKNLFLNNPPKKFYDDVKKTYPDIISESTSDRPSLDLEILKGIASDYSNIVIGQPNVLRRLLPALYSLVNPQRKKPITILFLGDSGVGKTETAKFINSKFGREMLRIQFSMQQTGEAYKYIFGGEHGEDSFARELIRRESNVILLDEFDKVNSLFYNAFYQMFDEGLFVDKNYSVNVERCIIICTSNYKSAEEAEKCLGSPIFSRFSKVIRFDEISIEDKLKIAAKNYNVLYAQLSGEDQKLIERNVVLNTFLEAIRRGYYKNMRTLKNDIEDALNIEVLKARGILTSDSTAGE